METLPSGHCQECGVLYGPDPDGSPGVIVHTTDDGDVLYALDRDHTAVPEEQKTS